MLSFPFHSSNIDRISIVRIKCNILSMDFVGFLSHEHRICILKERQRDFPQWIACCRSCWNQKKGKRESKSERTSDWARKKILHSNWREFIDRHHRRMYIKYMLYGWEKVGYENDLSVAFSFQSSRKQIYIYYIHFNTLKLERCESILCECKN